MQAESSAFTIRSAAHSCVEGGQGSAHTPGYKPATQDTPSAIRGPCLFFVQLRIAGKTYAQIFQEFEGAASVNGSGDVKYHLGTEGTFKTALGAEISVYLAADAHLEAVNGVLEGMVRARQDSIGDGQFSVLPILVHGDAAMAGQGVVFETLQMSQLRAYRTGGTVHLVVNNQIGFTTTPRDGRSSTYATDIAKAIDAPILHVNSDDPEAVVRVAELAFAYRQEFNRDIVIDLLSYRRRGHNEGDDPTMTQSNT